MAFADYIYQSDSAVSFQIRIDTDQAQEVGGVAGVSDVPAHVRISSTRREFGVQPRHVTLKRLAGTAPNQKVFSTKLAVCTPAVFDALQVGATLEVNGVSYRVASKTPEINR